MTLLAGCANPPANGSRGGSHEAVEVLSPKSVELGSLVADRSASSLRFEQ